MDVWLTDLKVYGEMTQFGRRDNLKSCIFRVRIPFSPWVGGVMEAFLSPKQKDIVRFYTDLLFAGMAKLAVRTGLKIPRA